MVQFGVSNFNEQINIQNLASGNYFVKLIFNDNSLNLKLIKN
ncbi:MAG: T9SS type A sorting domain-containing protein [Flavobacterium sp.]|nr:T9SS type A sorting domain-containing protein [Flavobacterium sp.]